LDPNFETVNGLPPLTPLVGYQFPVIFTQPQSQTVASGSNVTFGVTASSLSQLNFQWKLNGTNISGGTSITIFTTNTSGQFGFASQSALTLTNVTTNQAGAYSVTITNTFGSVTSSNAVLSVYTSAAATFNTFSLSASNGFQFTVTGVSGFNYAVQASTNLIDWVSLITNTSPFSFADTNTPGFQQRFYRSIYLP
jgi:hypothetical protein